MASPLAGIPDAESQLDDVWRAVMLYETQTVGKAMEFAANILNHAMTMQGHTNSRKLSAYVASAAKGGGTTDVAELSTFGVREAGGGPDVVLLDLHGVPPGILSSLRAMGFTGDIAGIVGKSYVMPLFAQNLASTASQVVRRLLLRPDQSLDGSDAGVRELVKSNTVMLELVCLSVLPDEERPRHLKAMQEREGLLQ